MMVNRVRRLVSRTGIVWCVAHLGVVAFCLLFAMAPATGREGKFIFSQIPIALQLALADELGLERWLRHTGWVEGYFIFGIPTLIISYAIGWWVDRERAK